MHNALICPLYPVEEFLVKTLSSRTFEAGIMAISAYTRWYCDLIGY